MESEEQPLGQRGREGDGEKEEVKKGWEEGRGREGDGENGRGWEEDDGEEGGNYIIRVGPL